MDCFASTCPRMLTSPCSSSQNSMPSPGSSIPVQEKPSAGNVLPNCSYPTRSITLPTTKQSLRFLLETATPYSCLTLRNIGQRQEIFSRLISYLYANAMQATNQGVGSSNLSGRANKSNSYKPTVLRH